MKKEDGIPYAGMSCPIAIREYPHILLAHGGGGRLMRVLIEKLFLTVFPPEAGLHDSSVFRTRDGKMAMTTDSYVVRPLQFPGGDIGSLAVHGTVNDLAVSGARPRFLSAGFILEEGLSVETLWEIVTAMADAAERAGVTIITGDTKVVERGNCDGMYINTAGVGEIVTPQPAHPDRIRPGDRIILNGDVGRHGIAIMAIREGLAFETEIRSDSAPVWNQVESMIAGKLDLHCMRDLTRGGLATAVLELADSAGCSIALEDAVIPVSHPVRAACEILGLDPLYVANEGRFISIVPPEDAEKAVQLMEESGAPEPVIIGTVTEGSGVTLKGPFGTSRVLDMMSGEQLPRIC